VNWTQLRTLLWLHSRLYANRMRRGGAGNVIVQAIVSVMSLVLGIVTFLVGFLVGTFALVKVSPSGILLVFDGLVAGFFFMWIGELLLELQRTEVLSLDKFLHLPVSPSGLFLINYIASYFCLSINFFLPAMFGISIGLVISKGAYMVLLFPMVAGFFVMVTALTHQFRGWVASLMENKRRRRNIVSIATLVFVLLTQLPNFIIWGTGPSRSGAEASRREIAKLDRSLAAKEINAEEYRRQADAIYQKYRSRPSGRNTLGREEFVSTASLVSVVVPLAWIAYGAMGAAQTSIPPALLATLGMLLIATVSLMRSYRTTLLLYTGQFTGSMQETPETGKVSAAFMEKSLPWISEHASAVAVLNFRSLTRAPEAKMLLMTPISMVIVFGMMFLKTGSTPAEVFRPLMPLGVMLMTHFGLLQLAGNQFGFDRSGFRAYVLAPMSRADILIGKNLSILPFAIVFGMIQATIVEIAYPMRVMNFLGVLVQLVSMALVYCLLTNLLSMVAPVAQASGSMKPARPRGIPLLLQMTFIFAVFPASMSITALPLGISMLLNLTGWLTSVPVFLILALMELGLILYLYPRVIQLQGTLLQSREQKILEVVTSRVE
jgi:ABC-2 type transport system permease protein